ncbi:hypothetical protein EUX98_g6921 [Antrodiella citrinella]|uniref:Uncharacterized protein n=1 Tax=Antrodiella citrinella TaxID=2447956 RepID=A0A4S4MMZ8_9APHY|nr:hypothetical protein EUX98_g6921 [Antrodiella citrinella]
MRLSAFSLLAIVATTACAYPVAVLNARNLGSGSRSYIMDAMGRQNPTSHAPVHTQSDPSTNYLGHRDDLYQNPVARTTNGDSGHTSDHPQRRSPVPLYTPTLGGGGPDTPKPDSHIPHRRSPRPDGGVNENGWQSAGTSSEAVSGDIRGVLFGRAHVSAHHGHLARNPVKLPMAQRRSPLPSSGPSDPTPEAYAQPYETSELGTSVFELAGRDDFGPDLPRPVGLPHHFHRRSPGPSPSGNFESYNLNPPANADMGAVLSNTMFAAPRSQKRSEETADEIEKDAMSEMNQMNQITQMSEMNAQGTVGAAGFDFAHLSHRGYEGAGPGPAGPW